MIEVKGLTKRYGANIALDHISFSVEQGTIVGFLGPNGAGKSTTMNIITGYLSASSGSVSRSRGGMPASFIHLRSSRSTPRPAGRKRSPG